MRTLTKDAPALTPRGADDQVQIQAALDAAHAADGGEVLLGPGEFVVDKAAGQVTIDGTANATKDGDDTVLSSLSFANGALADVALGAVLYVYDGDDGEGNTLEDNKDSGYFTVTAKDATTITLLARIAEEGTPDYTAVKFVALNYALKIYHDTPLRGVGIMATHLKLADAANCDVIHVVGEGGGAKELGSMFETFWVNGNRANQTRAADNAVGLCNGVVLGEEAWDVHVRDVAVDFCKGNGVIACRTWGLQWSGGWVEYHDENGFWAGIGSCGIIRDVKVCAQEKHAFVLHGTNGLTIQGCTPVEAKAGYFAFDLHGTRNTQLLGNSVGGAGGNVRMSYGAGGPCKFNLIKGNHLWAYTGDGVVTIVGSVFGNMIEGNFVRPASALRMLSGDSVWCDSNVCKNNFGHAHVLEDTRDGGFFKNVSGGALSKSAVVIRADADPDTMNTTTVDGDDRVLGVITYYDASTVANGAYGYVATKGYVFGVTVKNSNFAVGDYIKAADAAGQCDVGGAGDVVFGICQTARAPGGAATIDAVLIEPKKLE